MPELREAIAAHVKRRAGPLAYEPSQVLVTVGAKQALFNLCQTVSEAGDEAIVPQPYGVSYPEMVPGRRGTRSDLRALPGLGTTSSCGAWPALDAVASDRARLALRQQPQQSDRRGAGRGCAGR